MKLQAYRLQNYRRLRDVVIELDDEMSIFVGANNSGKTSAVQGLHSMLRGDAAIARNLLLLQVSTLECGACPPSSGEDS